MSLVLGKTVIASNTKCKYDYNAISSISSTVLSIDGKLSSLNSLSSISVNSLCSVSQIDSLSTCILDNLSSQLYELSNIMTELCATTIDRTDGNQFMDMNIVQKFNELCVGPAIYENKVNGWYYVNDYSEGLTVMIGNPESNYVVGQSLIDIPCVYFQNKMFTPVKAGTKLCFIRTSSNGKLASGITKMNLASKIVQFIPCAMYYDNQVYTINATTFNSVNGINTIDYKINLSADEWRDVDFSHGFTTLSIPIKIDRFAGYRLDRKVGMHFKVMAWPFGSSVIIPLYLNANETSKTFNVKLVIKNQSLTDSQKQSAYIRMFFVKWSDDRYRYVDEYSENIIEQCHIAPMEHGPISISCSNVNLVDVYAFDPITT